MNLNIMIDIKLINLLKDIHKETYNYIINILGKNINNSVIFLNSDYVIHILSIYPDFYTLYNEFTNNNNKFI